MTEQTATIRSAAERFGDPTEAELVARAAGLRDLIRAQQDEAERLGRYTEEVHQAILDAGLYHVLTPKRYGGFEFSYATFLQIVAELARADPGSGWCYCLGHGHALSTASLWDEEVQAAAFGNDAGYFVASHSLQPGVVAKRVDGGYELTGRSGYQSGVPYATHATVNAIVEGTGVDGPPVFVQALVPRAQYTIADDWGGDTTLGMRASGSNSVLLDGAFVPDGWAVEVDWLDETERTTSNGARLHDNPMYLGVAQTFLQSELAGIMIGTARAALDEYEQIIRARPIAYPPFTPRLEDPQHLRDYGTAFMKTNAAEFALRAVLDEYLARSTRAFRDGIPFTRAMDVELFGTLLEIITLAAEAVELLFRSGGASAAKKGARLERYYRDVSMARVHLTSQEGPLAQRVGAVLLGVAPSIF